jgi:hypothetical protein
MPEQCVLRALLIFFNILFLYVKLTIPQQTTTASSSVGLLASCIVRTLNSCQAKTFFVSDCKYITCNYYYYYYCHRRRRRRHHHHHQQQQQEHYFQKALFLI